MLAILVTLVGLCGFVAGIICGLFIDIVRDVQNWGRNT